MSVRSPGVPARRDRQETGRQPRARQGEQDPAGERPEVDLPAEHLSTRRARRSGRPMRTARRRSGRSAGRAGTRAQSRPRRSGTRRPSDRRWCRGTCRPPWAHRRSSTHRPGGHARDRRRGPAGHRQAGERDDRCPEERERDDRVEDRDERVTTDGHEARQHECRDRQPGVERVGRPAAASQQPAGAEGCDDERPACSRRRPNHRAAGRRGCRARCRRPGRGGRWIGPMGRPSVRPARAGAGRQSGSGRPTRLLCGEHVGRRQGAACVRCRLRAFAHAPRRVVLARLRQRRPDATRRRRNSAPFVGVTRLPPGPDRSPTRH